MQRAPSVVAILLVACSGSSGADADGRLDASDGAPGTPSETALDGDDTIGEAAAPDAAGEVVEVEGDPACDNLDPSHCLFPYPSDRFVTVGADGRRRLALEGALPRDEDGVMMTAPAFAERDGWSPQTPIIFTLPGLALPTPVPRDGQPFDIAASLLTDSPTVVIRADTGERVAHWIELDHFARERGAAIVFLRCARPLAFGARYIVAVRGLVDAAGRPLPATPGFAALRDGRPSSVAGIEERRAHFEASVFPALEAASIERASLQLAWDFTTATEGDTVGPIVAMAEALYAGIGPDGPAYTIDGVDAPGQEHVARLLRLTVKVPSFLLPADERGVRLLRRGADGLPVAEGTEEVAVEIQVPESALAASDPVGIVQYGHGLFWSREEGRKDWLRELADREGFLVVALDMEGMSEPNIPFWANTLATDLGSFPRLAEWPAQGVVNHLAVQRLVRGRLAKDPTFVHEGRPLFDPERLYYYGNSQGGTLGATVMSLTRDVQRGVLGVPGCSFSFLIHKSVGFTGFAELIQAHFPDPYEFAAILGLVALGFDRVEPLNLVSRLVATDPPAIARRVLLQVAKEDATVDNQVSFQCGRAYGATLVAPPVRPVWGLPQAPAPITANALAEFDFGVPLALDPFAPAPVATDTHEHARRLRVAQDQLARFLATGEVVHLCDGVCDPD